MVGKPVIPRARRQEDCGFEASLGCTAAPCLSQKDGAGGGGWTGAQNRPW
jgi:hypothetical protein